MKEWGNEPRGGWLIRLEGAFWLVGAMLSVAALIYAAFVRD